MGRTGMKNLHLLIWLTQLGLSTAAPLAGFVLLAVWLRVRFDLGIWVLLLGIGLGVINAIDGLRKSLKTLEKLSRTDRQESEGKTLSFNDHE